MYVLHDMDITCTNVEDICNHWTCKPVIDFIESINLGDKL